MDIARTWETLTSGQATVISGVLTVIAALSGVILGWKLFSGRVKNLETALAAAESKVQSHLKTVEGALSEYESKLNDQLSALALQLGQLSGSVADIPAPSMGIVPAEEQNTQDKLRSDWTRIRDRLEQIAANPEIDGRRRAKYSRIDRRRYEDLVSALQTDGALGADTTFYRDAVELWHKFRNGRATPSPENMQAMQNLARRLTGVSS